MERKIKGDGEKDREQEGERRRRGGESEGETKSGKLNFIKRESEERVDRGTIV